MMCFFQVEPQAVKMVRQAAEVQHQTVKVNHRAAKTAVTLKQQRRWIFICDVCFSAALMFRHYYIYLTEFDYSAKWCVSSLKWMMWTKRT